MAACCLQLSRASSRYGSCWLSACCVGFSGCWVRVQLFLCPLSVICPSHSLRHHNLLYYLLSAFFFSHNVRPPLVRETPGNGGWRFLHPLPVL